ncbi:MAG: DNA-directed RNA polymerase subunit alpha C-terminal domain-containing protein [Candidatus Micrarchaeota archaeon]
MRTRKLSGKSGSAAARRIAKVEEKPQLIEEQRLEEIRSRPVSSLKLEGLDEYAARRVKGALERRGVATLGDLQKMSDRDILLTKGLSEKAFRTIREEMRALGIPIGVTGKVPSPEPGTIEFEKFVSMPVHSLSFSGFNAGRARMVRSIWKENGIATIGEVVSRESRELRLKHSKNPHYGAGAGAIRALERELSGLGLRLGMANEMREHILIKTLATRVSDFDWSVRMQTCLKNAGMENLRMFEFVQITGHELLAGKNFGRKSMQEIGKTLQPVGLSLGMALDERTIEKAKQFALGAPPARPRFRGVTEKPFIRLNESGQIETNLSPEQLGTILRLAKKELADLRDDLQPHKLKVLGELLDMIEI